MLELVLLGLGGVGVIAMLALAFSGPSGEKAKLRRLTALKDRHSASTGAVVEAQMRRIQANRGTRMDGLAARIIPNPALLKKRISMTGKSWTAGQYLGACGIIAIVVAGLLFTRLSSFALGLPLSLLVGVAMGLLIPHLVVGFHINKRLKKFYARFPDAIELLVRGLRSGLPIGETLQVVASEIPGPVGEEFRMVSDKIKIGKTMDAALQDTAERLGTPEFQFFCITIAIQRETGGNLAETLQNLANVLRQRAQMKLKIKAMSSESKASAYIIGALPFIVFFLIWQVNSNYLMPFFVKPELMVIGMGGFLWMGVGAFIMKQMISFEI